MKSYSPGGRNEAKTVTNTQSEQNDLHYLNAKGFQLPSLEDRSS